MYILNSFNLEIAENFCPSPVSSGMFFEDKELSISKKKKRRKQIPCSISFTNEPISCPVEFHRLCLFHSTPKPKSILAVR